MKHTIENGVQQLRAPAVVTKDTSDGEAGDASAPGACKKERTKVGAVDRVQTGTIHYISSTVSSSAIRCPALPGWLAPQCSTCTNARRVTCTSQHPNLPGAGCHVKLLMRPCAGRRTHQEMPGNNLYRALHPDVCACLWWPVQASLCTGQYRRHSHISGFTIE